MTNAIVDVEPLDADLAGLVARAARGEGLHQMPVVEARRSYRKLIEDRSPDASGTGVIVEDVVVPMTDGGSLAARIYAPVAGSEGDAAILYLHGGGFVIGDLDTHDPLCRRLAAAVGTTLVSVAYRLAPEHPHAAARADAVGALTWMLARARLADAPWSRIVIAGDSAGANLAVWTALAQGAATLAGLVLIYPHVSFGFQSASRTARADDAMLPAATIAHFGATSMPLGEDPSLLDEALGQLPPTLIVTAGHDPLRDDGVALADAIVRAGGSVDRLHFPTLVHGFANLGHRSRGASSAIDDIATVMRRLVGSPPR